MVLKNIFPGCGVRASLMLFFTLVSVNHVGKDKSFCFSVHGEAELFTGGRTEQVLGCVQPSVE